MISEKEKIFNKVFSRGVVEAKEDDSAEAVAHLMVEHDIGVVVVMNNQELIGIISERDIVRKVVSKGLSTKATKARDIMTTDVTTVNLKDGFDNICKTLSNAKFRHLPIMSNEKLVGIVSQRDILDSLIPDNKV